MGRLVTLCTCQWADIEFEETCKLAKSMRYRADEKSCDSCKLYYGESCKRYN